MPPDLAAARCELPSEGFSAAGNTLARLTLPATFDHVRAAISEAMNTLAPLDLSSEESGSVQLILAETLNNVVEHAYDPRAPGEVSLILRHGRAGLLVEVRDNGRPMPNGRPPINDTPSEAVAREYLPEGGFGWFLIRELARDLVYDRRDGENILIFRMAIGKPAT